MPHAAAFWEPLAKVPVKFASTIQVTIAILLTVGLTALVFASQVRLPNAEGLPGFNAPAMSTNVSTTQVTAVILRKVALIALESVFFAQFPPETLVRPPRVQHVVASSEPHVEAPMKSASIIQTTIAIRSVVGPIALASASLEARLENARQYQPPDQPVQDQQARPAVVLQESPVKVLVKSVSTTQVTIAIRSTVEPIASASAFLLNPHSHQLPQVLQNQQAPHAVALLELHAKVWGKSVSTTQVMTVTRSTVGPIALACVSLVPHHSAEVSQGSNAQARNGFALTTQTTAVIPTAAGLIVRVFVFPAPMDPHVVVSRGNYAQARTTSASMTRVIIVIQRRAEATALAFAFIANSLLIHAPIASKRSMASAGHELARIWLSNLHEQHYWGIFIGGICCT